MSTETYDDERDRIPYYVAIAAVVLGFAIFFMASLIVQLIAHGFGASLTNPPPAVNDIDNFIFDAAFVLAALYFTTVRGVMGRAAFGYRRIPWRVGIGAFFAGAVLYYIVTLVYSAIVHVHGTDRLPSGLGVHTSTAAAIAVAVYVCAVAPMAEEFFFRGFLFGILRRMQVNVGGHELGPWVAAAIVGILFGLAHFSSAQPEYLIPLGFLGFVLCIMRWKTGSLYPGMALHSVNNCIALGVNELAWNGGQIVALIIGSLAVIALVTGPLSRGVPSGVAPS
ncbi:MAG: CPBP family intramembrane metalloprotease [Conexibacteraceae bacterium]|nr:CPBP family intramembrane metalloprotease [Conexibacteraceae bacterium]